MSSKPPEPKGSEITPEPLYLRRRQLLKGAALFTGTAVGVGAGLQLLSRRPSGGGGGEGAAPPPPGQPSGPPTVTRPRGPYDTDEAPTSYEDVTTYNNFYEFGLDKGDPADNAHTLQPRPWTVVIDGEVHKPQRVDMDTLQSWFPLEDRVYRMRCVEAWSKIGRAHV